MEIEYISNLYLSDNITPKRFNRIKKNLAKKAFTPDIYLITISANPRDNLDIFNSYQLKQSHFDSYHFTVVGIALDYFSAVALVENIVNDCLKKRNDLLLKEFLLC